MDDVTDPTRAALPARAVAGTADDPETT